jgi:hypothetical protein
LAPDHEVGEIAAVEGESLAQLVPRRRIHLAGYDAEIEADIDEDSADRTVPDLGDDLLGGGRQARVVGQRCGWFGGARLALARRADAQRLDVAAAGDALAEPFFEQGGAEQAALDAGEDLRDVLGTEHCRDEAEEWEEMRLGGVVFERFGEIFAVAMSVRRTPRT